MPSPRPLNAVRPPNLSPAERAASYFPEVHGFHRCVMTRLDLAGFTEIYLDLPGCVCGGEVWRWSNAKARRTRRRNQRTGRCCPRNAGNDAKGNPKYRPRFWGQMSQSVRCKWLVFKVGTFLKSSQCPKFLRPGRQKQENKGTGDRDIRISARGWSLVRVCEKLVNRHGVKKRKQGSRDRDHPILGNGELTPIDANEERQKRRTTDYSDITDLGKAKRIR